MKLQRNKVPRRLGKTNMYQPTSTKIFKMKSSSLKLHSEIQIVMLFKTPNWMTMIHWIVFLIICHNDQIPQGLCNGGEKVLKICPKSVQFFPTFEDPFPCNWTTMIHWNVVQTILHIHWYTLSLWKIVRTTIQCIIVLELQGEGPKKHLNFMDSGPRSTT